MSGKEIRVVTKDNLLGSAELLAKLKSGDMTPAEFVKLSKEFGAERHRRFAEPDVDYTNEEGKKP